MDKQTMLNTAREEATKGVAYKRLASLFDDGMFTEIDPFVKSSKGYAEISAGYGTVNGSKVFAFSQNSTNAGGALSTVHARKIKKLFDLAAKAGAPIVAIYDSIGGRIDEGMEMLSSCGDILNAVSNLSGVVPTISVVLGPCLGTSAVFAANSDFIIKSKKGVLSLNVEDNEDSSLYAMTAKDDNDAIESTKKLLSYLPMNNISVSGFESAEEPTFKQGKYIESAFDANSFTELYRESEQNSVIGFASLNGVPVGVIKTCGKQIDAKDCGKIARFVRFCDAFSLPVVTFADSEGFKDIKTAAKLSAIYAESSTIKLTVITGKAYGTFFAALAGNGAGTDLTIALNDAVICTLAPKTGVAVLWQDKLNKTPLAKRDALVEQFIVEEATALKAAEKGYIQDVITEDELRAKLLSALEMLEGKRVLNTLPKKHNNIII